MSNISWKGQTINQITSSIQKNQLSTGSVVKWNIFRALPLKLHRRELSTNIPSDVAGNCPHSRHSNSIDELNRPGGFVITSSSSTKNGLVNILESPAPSNLTETYGCKSNSFTCAEQNARKRCRSSGIIKRVYDPVRSELAYFTNTNQYLVSRSKSFAQNQYSHPRANDTSLVTNPLVSKEIFSPNGVSHCPKAVITTELKFYYYWIDADFTSTPPPTRYEVKIPPGSYDVNDFNVAFETAMFANKHYFLYTPTHEKVFLMKIIYNNTNGQVEIQSFSTSTVPSTMYIKPFTATGWSYPLPGPNKVPVFEFPATGIQTVVGFSSGTYPNITASPTANVRSTSVGFLSNLSHSIYPSYSIMYYKPSNNRFATQGGVSSSDMTVRLKYEAISKSAYNTSGALGSQVANAMSYRPSDYAYTIKDKLGFPEKKTPVIDKYTGELKCESNGRKICK